MLIRGTVIAIGVNAVDLHSVVVSSCVNIAESPDLQCVYADTDGCQWR
jgi:hypothetical protein